MVWTLRRVKLRYFPPLLSYTKASACNVPAACVDGRIIIADIHGRIFDKKLRTTIFCGALDGCISNLDVTKACYEHWLLSVSNSCFYILTRIFSSFSRVSPDQQQYLGFDYNLRLLFNSLFIIIFAFKSVYVGLLSASSHARLTTNEI
jgi:hypothetical protein